MHGENKLLLNIQGAPMIRRVVQAALESKVDEVIVVLGHEQDRIRAALNGLRCRLIVNTKYEEGQSSSVRVGLREVNPQTHAALILPGDVAKIDRDSIDKIIARYEQGGCAIVIAAHQGKHGHPILFDRQLFPEIERINETSFGLKAVVKKHEMEICLIEAGSENVLKDIDTPDDLKRL
jgi:molybdenum cofactor cytidylyltransferase